MAIENERNMRWRTRCPWHSNNGSVLEHVYALPGYWPCACLLFLAVFLSYHLLPRIPKKANEKGINPSLLLKSKSFSARTAGIFFRWIPRFGWKFFCLAPSFYQQTLVWDPLEEQSSGEKILLFLCLVTFRSVRYASYLKDMIGLMQFFRTMLPWKWCMTPVRNEYFPDLECQVDDRYFILKWPSAMGASQNFQYVLLKFCRENPGKKTKNKQESPIKDFF